MYISEMIKMEYLDWKAQDEVYIQTPTGSGKTTFVLEKLALHAKQMKKDVLLLVNRKILRDQIKRTILKEHGVERLTAEEVHDINSFDGITVLTYQELQEELKRKRYPMGRLYEKHFSYIVFDEVHYVLQDATFNRDIQYLVEAIPKIQNATKVFMSATMENVYPFICKILQIDQMMSWGELNTRQKSIYEYQKTYFTKGRVFFYCSRTKPNVNSVKYIEQLKEISSCINADQTQEKWLIFVNSKREAEELKNEIKVRLAYLDADIDADNPVKKQIVDLSSFQEKVLVTTKVLDNGINLIDKDLKNIVLLTTDKTEFIQMLGRKRIADEKDSVRVYIMRRDIKYFNAMRNKQIAPIIKFIKDIHQDGRFKQERFDEDEFCDFCKKIALIKGDHIEISKAAEEKIKNNGKFYDDIIEKFKYDSDAFIKEQLRWLDIKDEFIQESYCNYEEKLSCYKKLCDYLHKMVGVEMENNDQVIFRENVKNLALECGKILTDRKGRIPGKAKINNFCKKEGITLEIKSIKNSSTWVVKEEKNDTE